MAVQTKDPKPAPVSRWAIVAFLLLSAVVATGMVYAANVYLAPVEAGAQELACVPSWANACSSVEVAVSDDQLRIHVPNGGFPRAASARKRPASPLGYRSPSAWRSGSETPTTQPIEAERISAPTGVLAGGPALAG